MIPKKIIYSKNATIVFWQDGSKTVVKREKGVKDDKYSAVCAALAKKTYGSNSHFKKLIKDAENAKEIPKQHRTIVTPRNSYAKYVADTLNAVDEVEWRKYLW